MLAQQLAERAFDLQNHQRILALEWQAAQAAVLCDFLEVHVRLISCARETFLDGEAPRRNQDVLLQHVHQGNLGSTLWQLQVDGLEECTARKAGEAKRGERELAAEPLPQKVDGNHVEESEVHFKEFGPAAAALSCSVKFTRCVGTD